MNSIMRDRVVHRVVMVMLLAFFAVSGVNGAFAVSTQVADISIVNFAYNPSTFGASAGAQVTWQNNSGTTHTVTAQNSAFNSGNIAGGASYSHTFATAGTYDYFCTIHPSMQGKVVITDPAVRVESTDPAVQVTQPWNVYQSANASGGDLSYLNVALAGMSYTFQGTGFKVIGPKANLLGKVRICYDGSNCVTVDQYSSTTKWQQVLRSVTGLPLATHDVVIQVLGKKRAASTGKTGAIDAFDILQ